MFALKRNIIILLIALTLLIPIAFAGYSLIVEETPTRLVGPNIGSGNGSGGG